VTSELIIITIYLLPFLNALAILTFVLSMIKFDQMFDARSIALFNYALLLSLSLWRIKIRIMI